MVAAVFGFAALSTCVIPPRAQTVTAYGRWVSDQAEPPRLGESRMRLRYAGQCRLCMTPQPAGTVAIYERDSKTVRCLDCSPEMLIPPVHVSPDSAAGTSARREYERRKARDKQRIRDKWGRLSGIALALSDERQSTQAWQRGAIGEERLGARLNRLASEGITVLHDRRIPRTSANIDHLAVTKSGIWVIDAKRYKGRPSLKVEGGILRPREERLLVGGRDCTKLVHGVRKQVDVVRALVLEVPVTGVLCFVEADWPLIGGAFTTNEVRVLWPKLLGTRLVEANDGSFDPEAICTELASRLSPA